MAFIDSDERNRVAAVAALTDCNPFLPRRVELQKEILGSAFVPMGTTWHADGEASVADPNRAALRERIEALAAKLQGRLAAREVASDAELGDYRGLIFYLLWLRYEDGNWGRHAAFHSRDDV